MMSYYEVITRVPIFIIRVGNVNVSLSGSGGHIQQWSIIEVEQLTREMLQVMFECAITYSGHGSGVGNRASAWISIILHRIEQMESKKSFKWSMGGTWAAIGITAVTSFVSIFISIESQNLSKAGIDLSGKGIELSNKSLLLAQKDDKGDARWMKSQKVQNEAVIKVLKEIRLQIKDINKANDLKKVQDQIDQLIKTSSPTKK